MNYFRNMEFLKQLNTAVADKSENPGDADSKPSFFRKRPKKLNISETPKNYPETSSSQCWAIRSDILSDPQFLI